MKPTKKNKLQKIAEQVEIVDETGQDNEKKAAKAVKEVMGEREKEAQQVVDKLKNELDGSVKSRNEYLTRLQKMLYVNLYRVDWPNGYQFRVRLTDEGILMELFDTKSRRFARGFKPVFDPEYDYTAVDMFVQFAENTVDVIEGRIKLNEETGIIYDSPKGINKSERGTTTTRFVLPKQR
jgi:hypothetical protein